MNRSTPGLLISKSIDGFLKFKTAEGLSIRTITSYEYTLNHWLKYIGDRNVSDVQAWQYRDVKRHCVACLLVYPGTL